MLFLPGFESSTPGAWPQPSVFTQLIVGMNAKYCGKFRFHGPGFESPRLGRGLSPRFFSLLMGLRQSIEL